ncbi:MAG TPA: ABC transporter substrate-binding protein [Rhodopila sp.]|jgi:branched-chain amino acid transport system substrate-binding protein|nr:ABC transporter substrate-binding protein [Rhodopila sp.]
MIGHRALALISCAVLLGLSPAAAQDTIKIGDINSYKAMASSTVHYKRGAELAIEEVNAAGGVLGRKLELISRDDGANPGDAVRIAEELISRDHVALLSGTILSNVGLAVTDFAKQRKVFFLASAPLTDKIVYQDGNRYTFRLRASTYSHAAALVPLATKLNKKRWALVYPNYEYGQSAVETFKQLMKKAQPDVQFVADMATPLGKIDAGAVTQAIADAKPDAIFNVLFGSDLAKFVREGESRELFKGREVVSLLTGEPEYLDPLGSDAPKNWLVTGYPWYAIHTPEHEVFLAAYQKRFNDYPRMASLVGYDTFKALAAGITKAGSVDSDKLAAAFRGLAVDTPAGPITFRPQDHQSTFGLYVGRTGVKDGKGYMQSFTYVDGATLQPPDADVKKWRSGS